MFLNILNQANSQHKQSQDQVKKILERIKILQAVHTFYNGFPLMLIDIKVLDDL